MLSCCVEFFLESLIPIVDYIYNIYYILRDSMHNIYANKKNYD